jgi:HSP20 family protein
LERSFLYTGDFLTEKKEPPTEKKEAPKTAKKEIAVPKKKTPAVPSPQKKQTPLVKPAPTDLMQSFDEVFERFRQDFRGLLLPSSLAMEKMLDFIPETRTPTVDLEDRGKDYVLKAEMPGFKKEDIEIRAYDDAVEVSAIAGWKYDKKKQNYVCKERACESFYRMVPLPEEIKVDNVQADLKDGLLELVMPKKAQKQAKKINLK